MKRCTKCQEEKPLSEFYSRVLRRQDGTPYRYHERWCKPCFRLRVDARASDPAVKGAILHRARQRCREERKEQRRRSAIAEGRRYMTADERAFLKSARAMLAEIEAEIKRRERAEALAAKAPRQDRSLSDADRFRLRYRGDPDFALKQRVRTALRRKRQGIRLDNIVRSAVARNGRSSRAESFLGYTMKELRQHLERQFDRRMTWDAFCDGRIHIDHIVPLSSFDLSDPDELRRAWSITNLRPLWAEENLRKGRAREYLV